MEKRLEYYEGHLEIAVRSSALDINPKMINISNP
jgi:hypothetical protein